MQAFLRNGFEARFGSSAVSLGHLSHFRPHPASELGATAFFDYSLVYRLNLFEMQLTCFVFISSVEEVIGRKTENAVKVAKLAALAQF